MPITGTKRRPYLQENLGALDVQLTSADLARIEEAAPRNTFAGPRYSAAMLQMVNRQAALARGPRFPNIVFSWRAVPPNELSLIRRDASVPPQSTRRFCALAIHWLRRSPRSSRCPAAPNVPALPRRASPGSLPTWDDVHRNDLHASPTIAVHRRCHYRHCQCHRCFRRYCVRHRQLRPKGRGCALPIPGFVRAVRLLLSTVLRIGPFL